SALKNPCGSGDGGTAVPHAGLSLATPAICTTVPTDFPTDVTTGVPTDRGGHPSASDAERATATADATERRWNGTALLDGGRRRTCVSSPLAASAPWMNRLWKLRLR